MTEPHTIRLRRLKMRAEHRGTKEMDLILGGWAAANLASASPALLDRFEEVLEENDQDLYQWVSGQADPPPHVADFIAELRAFVASDKKLVGN